MGGEICKKYNLLSSLPFHVGRGEKGRQNLLKKLFRCNVKFTTSK